jgi:hypothetical protein
VQRTTRLGSRRPAVEVVYRSDDPAAGARRCAWDPPAGVWRFLRADLVDQALLNRSLSQAGAAGMKRIVSGFVPDRENVACGFAPLAHGIEIPSAERAACGWREDEASVEGALRVVAELHIHRGAPHPGFMADPSSIAEKLARVDSAGTCFFLSEENWIFCFTG